MKKVKVQRYISGKRPEYAPSSDEGDQSEEDDFTAPRTAMERPMSPKRVSIRE